MKFKTITYQRVKNLGNYESERLELSVELDENDDEAVAIASLKSKVEQALGIESDQPPF
ncbi:MAG: hypothetical protein KME09_16345 [Pleurocapsa minor HA4230-MV1]|jgi:hypothetical protein|nr:hypothetical protein [Pleurocapsa minor HA4230-MV1]